MCLFLLVEAGAAPGRHSASSTASPSVAPSCSSLVRVALITDVGGLRSRADAGSWLGVEHAAASLPCLGPELITPARPSDYARRAQEAVDRHDALVIGGSFLLSDAIVDAARANPGTRFVLVDPLVTPPHLPNLDVIVFRRDQAAFLAGALAAMVSRRGVIGGVFGPGGSLDQENRQAFERGARDVNPAIQVLGAFQPATEGSPYENPSWGNAQARAFIDENADVIFGAGGTTAEGVALAAAQTGRWCIGADFDAGTYPAAAPCLLASTTTNVDRGVELEVFHAMTGGTSGGEFSVGLAEGAVALRLSGNAAVTPAVQERLGRIQDLLTAGQVPTGP